MQNFSHSLPMMLYRALHTVLPRFRTIFAEFGLTEPQWRVMRVLWEHDGIAFRDLAGLTLLPAPSLVGIIDRLHANGLVERRRSHTDRRNVAVHTTASGRTLRAAVMPAVEAAYRELDQALDKRTRAGLLAGLEALATLEIPPAEQAALND